MRILWLSDKMIGGYSAYSKVTYEVLTRLVEMGHTVAHIPLARANRMGKWVYKNILIYPSGEDPFCEDVVIKHYCDFKADLLITLKDLWVFNIFFKFSVDYAPYLPIDHSPVSPSITSRLHTAFSVIVPSRFAQRELIQADIDVPIHYIPHGVNTSIFRPLDKGKCKKIWFLDEDDFTVGIVAMNRARKMVHRMLRGYKLFKERNPDVKSHLLLWTDVRPRSRVYDGALSIGVADVGVNLLPEIMNLDLGEDVIWPESNLYREGIPDDGTDSWSMVTLYNAMDVLLLCSGGEGVGLPLLEAQSCGVPVITTNYAGAPEHVGAGLVVPVSDYVILNTPGTRYALADLDKMADYIAKIMNADREKLSRRARRFAFKFDWDRVMRYWAKFLDWAECELYPKVSKGGVGTWISR